MATTTASRIKGQRRRRDGVVAVGVSIIARSLSPASNARGAGTLRDPPGLRRARCLEAEEREGLPHMGRQWGGNLDPAAGGMRQAKGAGVEVKRMEETLEFPTNAAKLEYQVGYAEYLNATQNVDLAMQSYILAESIMEKTEIKFDQGTSSSFELSRQTSQLLQAEVSLIQARLSLMNAQTRLSKSLNAL